MSAAFILNPAYNNIFITRLGSSESCSSNVVELLASYKALPTTVCDVQLTSFGFLI